jgi:hypothetical protein
MNEELVSVEGLVLEKMMVLDESDDAVVLKNTRYNVDDVGDRDDRSDRGDAADDRRSDAGDKGDDRVEKRCGDKSGDDIKRFSYRELIMQSGTGRQLMMEILLVSSFPSSLLLSPFSFSSVSLVSLVSSSSLLLLLLLVLLPSSYYYYYYFIIIIDIIYYHNKVGMDGTPKEACSIASSVFYSGTYYSLVPVVNVPCTCYPQQLTQHNIHIINHNLVMNLIPIVMYS